MLQLLRERWSTGDLSSSDVQRFAAAATGSGAEGLRKLQKVAAGCKHPNNAQRDLMRALGKPRGSPDLHYSPIPVAGRDDKPTVTHHPFILPHALLSQLHASRKETFLQCVQGDSE